MPSIPEKEQEKSQATEDVKNETREVSQTDHLNKRLLTSFLQNLNANNAAMKPSDDQEPQKEDDKEWQD